MGFQGGTPSADSINLLQNGTNKFGGLKGVHMFSHLYSGSQIETVVPAWRVEAAETPIWKKSCYDDVIVHWSDHLELSLILKQHTGLPTEILPK